MDKTKTSPYLTARWLWVAHRAGIFGNGAMYRMTKRASQVKNGQLFRAFLLGSIGVGLLGGGALSGLQAKAASDWPELAHPVAKDPAMEARIAEIVAGMTLRQKIGQMTQADIRSVTPDQVRKKSGLLEGGEVYLFACTDVERKKVVVCAAKG